MERPTPRRATRPTAGSRERRLDSKRRRGQTKAGDGETDERQAMTERERIHP